MAMLTVYSYYNRAVEEREREHMPKVGLTKDRELLAAVTKVANSSTIQARICLCCAGKFNDVKCWRRHLGPMRGSGYSTLHLKGYHRAGNEIQFYTFEKLLSYAEDPL